MIALTALLLAAATAPPPDDVDAPPVPTPNPLLDGIERVPVVLVVAADLNRVALMDGNLDRPPVAGVVEQVRPGESGFLYDYNDMGAWKTCITDLVNDPELLKTMSEGAHKAFWKLTGYNEMLLSYKSIISRMIA